jgi:hypothetical protein
VRLRIQLADVFVLAGLTTEGHLQSFPRKPPFDLIKLAPAHLQYLGNLLTAALATALPGLVTVEQEQCSDDFLSCILAFGHHALELFCFFWVRVAMYFSIPSFFGPTWQHLAQATPTPPAHQA